MFLIANKAKVPFLNNINKKRNTNFNYTLLHITLLCLNLDFGTSFVFKHEIKTKKILISVFQLVREKLIVFHNSFFNEYTVLDICFQSWFPKSNRIKIEF